MTEIVIMKILVRGRGLLRIDLENGRLLIGTVVVLIALKENYCCNDIPNVI